MRPKLKLHAAKAGGVFADFSKGLPGWKLNLHAAKAGGV